MKTVTQYFTGMFLLIILIMGNPTIAQSNKQDLNSKTNDSANVFKIKSPNFKILFPEANSTIDASFNDLDSINNYNIPYFYKEQYLSAIIKQENDSIYFQPKMEKDIPVEVVYNDKTKVVNLVFVESPSAKYSKEYMFENNDKIHVEIPELYELLHITIAITRFNNDPNYDINPKNEINFMVNKKTEYHDKVINTFSKYKSHALITFLDKQFAEDFNRYHLFTANVYCLDIESNKVYKKDTYTSIWSGKTNFDELIPLIEDFYIQTGFKQFYSDNKEYYNKLITDYEERANVKNIHSWLNKVSGIKYNSFRYIISPLVFGGHKTQNFEQEDFNECLIFLPTFDYSKTFDSTLDKQKLLESIGVIFTEVDHNYVNPITEKYNSQIETSIKNLMDWNTKSNKGYYPTKIITFNEYLTHALFLLFAKENFEMKDFEEIKNFWIAQESDPNRRCFVKFKEFYNKFEENYFKQMTDNQSYNLEQGTLEILNWITDL
jgi:hypothetical protein